MKWNNAYSAKLVEEYGKHPCLWNPQDEDYRDKSARAVALKKIVTAMNIKNFDITDARRKIQIIRSTYWNEIAKIRNSMRGDKITDDVYLPKLAWFAAADKFLKHAPHWATERGANDSQTSDITDKPLDDGITGEPVGGVSSLEGDAHSRMKWNTNCIARLVEEYGRRPCLWNSEHQNYRNKFAREQAMLEIRQAMDLEDFDVAKLRKKIRIIRSTYWNEISKIKNSLKLNPVEVYKPKLHWFEAADKYLKHALSWASEDVMIDGMKTHNLEEKSDDIDIPSGLMPRIISVVGGKRNTEAKKTSYPDISRKISENCRIIAENARNATENMRNIPEIILETGDDVDDESHDQKRPCLEDSSFSNFSNRPNEIEAIGITWMAKLSRMNEMQKLLAEGLINKILTKGLFNELKRTTDVVDEEAIEVKRSYSDC